MLEAIKFVSDVIDFFMFDEPISLQISLPPIKKNSEHVHIQHEMISSIANKVNFIVVYSVFLYEKDQEDSKDFKKENR